MTIDESTRIIFTALMQYCEDCISDDTKAQAQIDEAWNLIRDTVKSVDEATPVDDPNTVKFEINREIVFAAEHVPLDEWNWLYETSQKLPFIETLEYGVYRIWAAVDDGEIAMATPQTYELIKRARLLDCKWLVLDHDGPVYPQLETYKW